MRTSQSLLPNFLDTSRTLFRRWHFLVHAHSPNAELRGGVGSAIDVWGGFRSANVQTPVLAAHTSANSPEPRRQAPDPGLRTFINFPSSSLEGRGRACGDDPCMRDAPRMAATLIADLTAGALAESARARGFNPINLARAAKSRPRRNVSEH